MKQDNLRARLAQSLIIGMENPEPDPHTVELISRHAVGGVILFARNIVAPEQVWRLNSSLQQIAAAAGRPPLFIMVDQEGGSVARLRAPFIHEPDLCVLGHSDEKTLFTHGAQMGRELIASGFNWNLAPVVDVHCQDGGVMHKRSLGSDPLKVGKLAAAYINGLHSAACLSCAKHFPGLGRTSIDTHKLGVKVELTMQQMREVELPPFVAAMAARVSGILVGHATFSALDTHNPASLSSMVIDGLLRQQLQYNGLVLSDDLEMGAINLDPAKAAAAAYQAGSDLLLICRRSEFAVPALEEMTALACDGKISGERICASFDRIRRLKAGLPAMKPFEVLRQILDKRANAALQTA